MHTLNEGWDAATSSYSPPLQQLPDFLVSQGENLVMTGQLGQGHYWVRVRSGFETTDIHNTTLTGTYSLHFEVLP